MFLFTGSPIGRGSRGRWVGVAVAAVLLSSGCSGPAVTAINASTQRAAVIMADAQPGDDLSSLDVLAGLSQAGGSIGDPAAPVVLTIYSDMSCDACHQAGRGLVTDLLAGPVKTGQLRIERAVMTIGGVAPQSAARIAIATGEQNKMWQFLQLYDRTIGEHTPATIDDPLLQQSLTALPGLDVAAANQAAATPAAATAVADNTQIATALGISGAPSYRIAGNGTEPVQIWPASPTDTPFVLAAIDQVAHGQPVTATSTAGAGAQCAATACTPG